MQVPVALINSLSGVAGFNKEAFERVHASGEQVTSIRLNPRKIKGLPQAFLSDKILKEKIPWSSYGYYLSQRPSFTLDPLLHAGAYYVQEASSMFLEEVLKQVADLSQPLRILDLCAAPGGKSTLIQSLISDNSLLISNEVIKTRANVLAENITKWGAVNVIITNNDPRDFQRLQQYFDIIVVDTPCSGSGLFRKDANAVEEWSEANVQLCSRRQQRILADIMPCLKDGGTLIYSTCSYSKEEDEEIADLLLTGGMKSVCLKLNDTWGIATTNSLHHNAFGYRFYPDKVKGEGFYIAAFRKQEASADTNGQNKSDEIKFKARSRKLAPREIANLQSFLKKSNDLFYFIQNEEVIALPTQFEKDLPIIQSALYIKKAGVKLGALIRNELIPDHELALSTIIAGDIPSVNVDKVTALQYLRRQDIKPVTMQKGWALLSYEQLPLGWIKVLNNRVNNYYPKDWRIFNK